VASIGEINEEKWGRLTPGTHIPIVPEAELLAKPGCLLVLPWHFREHFLNAPHLRGRELLFPLPRVDVVRV
jgi:hypothetical protein